MPFDRSGSLGDALENLERCLFDKLKHVHSALRPGASDAQLDAFESEYGSELPAQFRELYRWRDGADGFAGPKTHDTLPGCGFWLPLVRLPSACMLSQDGWMAGVSPDWVPVTSSEVSLVIDTAKGEAPEAEAHLVAGTEFAGSVGSVHEMADQMVGVVQQGMWAAGGGIGGFDGWAAEPGPEFTLFSPFGPMFVVPDQSTLPPLREWRPVRLATTGFGGGDHLSLAPEAARLVRQLLSFGVECEFRDAMMLETRRSLLDRVEAKNGFHRYQSLRDDLDLTWRVLDGNSVDPDQWHATFAEAESLVLVMAPG